MSRARQSSETEDTKETHGKTKGNKRITTSGNRNVHKNTLKIHTAGKFGSAFNISFSKTFVIKIQGHALNQVEKRMERRRPLRQFLVDEGRDHRNATCEATCCSETFIRYVVTLTSGTRTAKRNSLVCMHHQDCLCDPLFFYDCLYCPRKCVFSAMHICAAVKPMLKGLVCINHARCAVTRFLKSAFAYCCCILQ